MIRAVVLVLVACSSTPAKPTPPSGSAPPPPPDAAPIVVDAPSPVVAGPLDRDMPRLAERSVALYEGVAAAFRAAGTDCPAATKKLGELRAQFADVGAATSKVLHEGRARELKTALAKLDDKLAAATKEIVAAATMKQCAGDRAFTNAFDDLVGAPP